MLAIHRHLQRSLAAIVGRAGVRAARQQGAPTAGRRNALLLPTYLISLGRRGCANRGPDTLRLSKTKLNRQATVLAKQDRLD
jgi:hypothetical protein